MTARKTRRLEKIANLKKKDNKVFSLKIFWIGVLILVLVFVGILVFGKGSWNGDSQFSMVYGSSLEDVLVVSADPVSKKLVTIRIPKETNVDVAHELGIWPAGSVWDLGENEDLNGDLLAKTVTKTFKFPIEAWGSYGTLRLIRGNLFDKISSIFTFEKTSLSFRDKIRLALFSLQTQSVKNTEIDLADTSYLEEMKNFEGDSVYHLRGDIPTSVLKIFSDSTVSAEKLRIGIVNSGVTNTQVNEVTRIMEVLGTKVLSIRNIDDTDLDCVVKGDNKSITARKLASIFSCESGRLEEGSNLDLELQLGKKFRTKF